MLPPPHFLPKKLMGSRPNTILLLHHFKRSSSSHPKIPQLGSPTHSSPLQPTPSLPSQNINTPFATNLKHASQPFTSSQPLHFSQKIQPGRAYQPHQHSSPSPPANPTPNFPKHGPVQGYPPPRPTYQHSRQGYPPSQSFPNPPQRYPLPPQPYPHPPQRYSHPSQSFPLPARGPNHGPPRWSGQANPAAQWQFPRSNNYDSNYSQPFQSDRGPPRPPYQPQPTDIHGSAHAHPNLISHSKLAPDRAHGPTQPQNQAFPGFGRVPFSVAEGQARPPWLAPHPHFPAFGTPPLTRPSGSHGGPSPNNADSDSSNTSMETPLANRRKLAPISSQSYGFDMSDVSGLHTLDQFVGKHSRPSASPFPSPREPQSMQPSRHAGWNQGFPQYPPHQYSGFHPSGFNEGPRPGLLAPTPSPVGRPAISGISMREGFARPPNRGGFAAQGGMTGAQVGARRGAGRERGRGNALGLQRARGRGSLFNKFEEPSLPPPPQSVLNEKGEFGQEPRPSGCPHGMAALSEGITHVDGKVKVELAQATDYKSISNLLISSSTPIELPGFEKPIQMSPILTEPSKPNYEIESGGNITILDQKKREDVVGRARNLVSQNNSMDLDQKKQVVAVVDFLLLSRQERMQRVV